MLVLALELFSENSSKGHTLKIHFRGKTVDIQQETSLPLGLPGSFMPLSRVTDIVKVLERGLKATFSVSGL